MSPVVNDLTKTMSCYSISYSLSTLTQITYTLMTCITFFNIMTDFRARFNAYMWARWRDARKNLSAPNKICCEVYLAAFSWQFKSVEPDGGSMLLLRMVAVSSCHLFALIARRIVKTRHWPSSCKFRCMFTLFKLRVGSCAAKYRYVYPQPVKCKHAAMHW